MRKHGKYFTLDHRRLYAMREALGDKPKPQRTVSCVRETFADAAGRFAAFYGQESADAERCKAAASLTSIEQYAALDIEVLAHH